MKKPVLKVRKYRHSATHPFSLDLRAFGQGRQFFKTRAEAEAACLRQKTALERHGREAVGLSAHEMSEFIKAKQRLAVYGKSITAAADFLIDFLEKIRRCKMTVKELAAEALAAKQKDGRAPAYTDDLRKRLARFCA